MAKGLGVAASGSAEVSQTAVEILKAGGNAFDAVLGALCTASIAEPLLVSLGGGGFLLGLPDGDKPRVYDFFCQTPGHRRPDSELDFYPIIADFRHRGAGVSYRHGLYRRSRRCCRDLRGAP